MSPEAGGRTRSRGRPRASPAGRRRSRRRLAARRRASRQPRASAASRAVRGHRRRGVTRRVRHRRRCVGPTREGRAARCGARVDRHRRLDHRRAAEPGPAPSPGHREDDPRRRRGSGRDAGGPGRPGSSRRIRALRCPVGLLPRPGWSWCGRLPAGSPRRCPAPPSCPPSARRDVDRPGGGEPHRHRPPRRVALGRTPREASPCESDVDRGLARPFALLPILPFSRAWARRCGIGPSGRCSSIGLAAGIGLFTGRARADPPAGGPAHPDRAPLALVRHPGGRPAPRSGRPSSPGPAS